MDFRIDTHHNYGLKCRQMSTLRHEDIKLATPNLVYNGGTKFRSTKEHRRTQLRFAIDSLWHRQLKAITCNFLLDYTTL